MIATAENRLADAWRGSLRELDTSIFWIKKHRDTIENSRYPRDVINSKALLPYRLEKYLDDIRRVSEFEERMVEAGMVFSREPA